MNVRNKPEATRFRIYLHVLRGKAASCRNLGKTEKQGDVSFDRHGLGLPIIITKMSLH